METECSVCGKMYKTYPVILDDNVLSLASEFDLRDKYYKDGKGLCESCRKKIDNGEDLSTYKKGFTCGSFDLIHPGHILMLKEAREQCDFLIVGLQTDPTIDRKNKNKPIQTLEERKIMLSGIKYVDEVVVYDTEESLYKLLEELKPDVRIIGHDWKGKKYTGWDLPIKMFFNSRDHNWSSSELRSRVKKL